MRDEEPPQLSGRDAAYLDVVRRLNQAAADAQPFQAAQEFGAAAAKHPGGEALTSTLITDPDTSR